jgi:hypothetical protein
MKSMNPILVIMSVFFLSNFDILKFGKSFKIKKEQNYSNLKWKNKKRVPQFSQFLLSTNKKKKTKKQKQLSQKKHKCMCVYVPSFAHIFEIWNWGLFLVWFIVVKKRIVNIYI